MAAFNWSDLIVAGINNGAELWKANRNSNTAQQNAATLTAANSQALEYYKQAAEENKKLYADLWAQQQQIQAPYLGIGNGATGMMAHMMGIKMPASAFKPISAVGSTPAPNKAPTTDPTPLGQSGFRTKPSGSFGRTIGQVGMTPGSGYDDQTGATDAGSVPVLMQAPNGQISHVPAGLAAYFEAMGAKRIG